MTSWFFAVFLSLFFALSSFAAEDCSLRTDPLTDLVKLSCEEAKASAQCQKVYQEITDAGGDAAQRSLVCDGGKNQSWLTSSTDWATGCLIGVGDYFVKLGTVLGETAAQIMLEREEKAAELAACDKDLSKKKLLYEDYNSRMPDVLHIAQPTESELQGLKCEKIQTNIMMEQRKLSMRAFNKVRARLNDRTATYTPEEQQFIDWTNKVNKPKVDDNVIDLAKAHLKKMGVQYECYNNKYQKALICEALAEVAPTLWGAAKAGAAGIKAARAQRLAKLAGVKKVDDFVADVNAAERATVGPGARITSAADKEKILAAAAGLTPEERIMALEKIRGKPLSKREAEQWLKMHDVGTTEGRGFGTYTKEDIDLKQKLASEINPDTGKPYFTDEEIKIGLRNGITGGLDKGSLAKVTPKNARELYAARAREQDYSQYHRLHAEAAAAEGKISEASDAYNNAYKAYVRETKVDLKDANSAKRTLSNLSERQLSELEETAARSGQVQQINEVTKAKWNKIEADIKKSYSGKPGYQEAVTQQIHTEYSNLRELTYSKNPLVKKAAEEKIKSLKSVYPGLK
ncbi:MAG: hypothetical protein NDI63_13495 [Pseudobdellovibrio sp.]|nr:hypothetical protein [Pseudobdellovibrio sp.]